MEISVWISAAALIISIAAIALSVWVAFLQFRCDASVRTKLVAKQGDVFELKVTVRGDNRDDLEVRQVTGGKGIMIRPYSADFGADGMARLTFGEPVPSMSIDWFVPRKSTQTFDLFISGTKSLSDSHASLAFRMSRSTLRWRVTRTARATLNPN